MKSILVLFLVAFAVLSILVDSSIISAADRSIDSAGKCQRPGDGRPGTEWKLVWSDEFESSSTVPNPAIWTRVKKGTADWQKHMNDTYPYLAQVQDGNLVLRGIIDPEDSNNFITGGLHSQHKYSFLYGKVEISAYYDSAQGQWPALWLLGEKGDWPYNGEIDLMEHLNFDDIFYQTVHSAWTEVNHSDKPRHGTTAPINSGTFNKYGMEWGPDEVVLTVNDQKTLHYPRVNNTGMPPAWQYPFVQPFYFVLSMQIGGSWVGHPVRSHYPTKMLIDYVRVYQCQ